MRWLAIALARPCLLLADEQDGVEMLGPLMRPLAMIGESRTGAGLGADVHDGGEVVAVSHSIQAILAV